MLHNLIVIRCEHGYRQALQFYVHQAQDKDLYDTVWRSGKTYYAARYFFQSLISGKSPRYFIHLIASEEIPKDTQKALADHGVEIHPIAFQTLIAFLNHRLGTDEFLPAEFKTMLTEVITSLSQHAWVADQVNQFLEMAFHDPERLYKFTETMTAPAPPAEPTP